jgi:hypothetical protein
MKTFGTITHDGETYLLTSSEYAYQQEHGMPQECPKTRVMLCFLGETTALTNHEGKIIGWPEDVLAKHLRNNFKVPTKL